MKKALYLILCCIFSLLSLFVFAVVRLEGVSIYKISGLYTGVVIFTILFVPTILFYILYTKERNKKVEASKRKYTGIKTMAFLIFLEFLDILQVIVYAIYRMIDYIKYGRTYVEFTSIDRSDIIEFFISYTFLSVILFVACVVISRFVKKSKAITEEISAQE